MVKNWLARLAIAAAAAACARMADAQALSPDAFHGLADLRLATANGERGWLDRGFGKAGVSGGQTELGLSQAVLEWKPSFGFAVSGVVSAQVQPDVDPALYLTEAYLKLQAPPSDVGRLSARAGVFYPPVSLEHEGAGWTTPDTLSASALNSWIGEEVKVAGLEATLRRDFGGHEVAATAAVFGWNDTSGTLLSFRGWALHEVRTGLETDFHLPPLSPFMQVRQAPITTPFQELDGRPGYYGHLEWRPPAPVSFNALFYDNGGNRIAVEAVQWAWETRFLNVGMTWQPDEQTRFAAQVMNGETLMGYKIPGGIWVDMGFSAAYVLAQREVGANRFSARLDGFETRDRSFRELDNNTEQGWALTGAWRRRLAPHLDLIVEGQHITSERPARALAGETARQGQDVLQSALRVSF